VRKLRAEGFDVRELDLVNGFDVTDPEAWEHIGSVDLACLNAGVITGESEIAALTDEQYRRAIGVNVDGVVYGVRRLDRVMPRGSTIVVTASLAGLTAISDDPIYGLTKHAVVGFVRSVAGQLSERGIRIQAVCPGWADTPLTTNGFRQELQERGFRLLSPEAVAEGVWAAYKSEGTGEAWIVQPGREPLHYEFKGVPGPR
jgi:NAD(P)-dependent dehydrogenase (short-subunit alcohol dehydrogenase family)